MPEVAPIWVGLLGRKSLKFAPPPSSSGESRFNQFRALTGSSIHHCPQRRDRLIQLLVAEPLTPRGILDFELLRHEQRANFQEVSSN
jgi:hypothetical protein